MKTKRSAVSGKNPSHCRAKRARSNTLRGRVRGAAVCASVSPRQERKSIAARFVRVKDKMSFVKVEPCCAPLRIVLKAFCFH